MCNKSIFWITRFPSLLTHLKQLLLGLLLLVALFQFSLPHSTLVIINVWHLSILDQASQEVLHSFPILHAIADIIMIVIELMVLHLLRTEVNYLRIYSGDALANESISTKRIRLSDRRKRQRQSNKSPSKSRHWPDCLWYKDLVRMHRPFLNWLYVDGRNLGNHL